MKLSRILIAVLACTSLLLAQEATTPAPKAAKAKKEACMGTVVSVDAIANTIIVTTKKGVDTISVESSTKIMSERKKSRLAISKRIQKYPLPAKLSMAKKSLPRSPSVLQKL